MSEYVPVANGTRTNHPVPNLPFVDDSHIPVTSPTDIEAIGRHAGTNMWGRRDHNKQTGEWIAHTTDPKNHAYAWIVQHHPEHGYSVLLHHDQDAASAHTQWMDRQHAQLVRAGGYWWDGHDWYRPRQVLDWAQERYVARPVRQPTTITAEDLLDSTCRPEWGESFKVAHFEPGERSEQQWRHDLALWSQHRQERGAERELERCVVTINAPELADTALLNLDQVAARAGLAASTLRAYITRDEADVPLPQSSTSGRKRWSVPVIDDWLEMRQRDSRELGAVLTGDEDSSLSPALRDSWQAMTETITSVLGRQKRRVLRRGNDPERFTSEAGWVAALTADRDRLHGEVLAHTVEKAVLWELSTATKLHSGDREHPYEYGLAFQVGKLLGWFIRTEPELAPNVFGAIVRQAEGELGIPPRVTANSIHEAISFDGGLPETEKARLDEFISVTLPPTAQDTHQPHR